MSWFAVHQELVDHPKTLRLMATMGWDIDTTLGKLLRFWSWCMTHAPDGDLRRFANEILAAAVNVPMVDAAKFVDAMKDAGGKDQGGNALPGFLEKDPYFRVHDWWGYFGPFLQSKFKKAPEKWRRVRDLYDVSALPHAGNGGSNGSGNGYDTGSKVSDSAPSPQTPLPNQDLNMNLPLQDRGIADGESAIVEIVSKTKTPQVEIVERWKVSYEAAVPGEQFKATKESYIIAARLITAHGFEAVIQKAKTLHTLCKLKSAWFTSDGFASFTLETLSKHWNRIIPAAHRPTEQDTARAELKRQEELRARLNSAAG